MLRQTKKISGFAPSHTGVGEGASLFKRVLVLIVCIALIGCFFAFPVSAETVDGQYYNGIKVTALTVNLIKADGTLIEVTPTVIYNNSLENVGSLDAPGYFVAFENPDGLMVLNEYYTIVLHLVTQSYLQTTDNYVIGGYDVLTDWTYENVGYYSASRSGGGHTQQTTPTVANVSGFNGINVNYTAGVLGHLYTSYVCSFRVRCLKSSNYFYLYIKNIDLRVISPSEKAAQSVIDNQDKNTQAIIDNEKELQENEKNEANSTGNEGVGEVTNAIPDYSSNLLEAFNKLTAPMIHEKTDCLIDFPEITVPSMNMSVMGVPITTPNVTLLEEQQINIETMAEKIPNSIMIVVKALLSIALYIFCYKEFYSIVEYIMTLKGAGK